MNLWKSPFEKILPKLRQTESGLTYKRAAFQCFSCGNERMIVLTAGFGFPNLIMLQPSAGFPLLSGHCARLTRKPTNPFRLSVFVNSPPLSTTDRLWTQTHLFPDCKIQLCSPSYSQNSPFSALLQNRPHTFCHLLYHSLCCCSHMPCVLRKTCWRNQFFGLSHGHGSHAVSEWVILTSWQKNVCMCACRCVHRLVCIYTL